MSYAERTRSAHSPRAIRAAEAKLCPVVAAASSTRLRSAFGRSMLTRTLVFSLDALYGFFVIDVGYHGYLFWWESGKRKKLSARRKVVYLPSCRELYAVQNRHDTMRRTHASIQRPPTIDPGRNEEHQERLVCNYRADAAYNRSSTGWSLDSVYCSRQFLVYSRCRCVITLILLFPTGDDDL